MIHYRGLQGFGRGRLINRREWRRLASTAACQVIAADNLGNGVRLTAYSRRFDWRRDSAEVFAPSAAPARAHRSAKLLEMMFEDLAQLLVQSDDSGFFGDLRPLLTIIESASPPPVKLLHP